MKLFIKFIRIISAVILFKVTGYAMMVILFLNKVELPWSIKLLGTVLLSSNGYFIWQSFRLQDRFPWGLFMSAVNLALVGAGLVLWFN